MRRAIIIVGALILVGMAVTVSTRLGGRATAETDAGAPVASEQSVDLEDPVNRISYAIGLDFGRSMRETELAVNPGMFVRGLRDGLSEDAEPLLAQDQVREALLTFQQQIQQKAQEKQAEVAAQNQQEARAFLAQNAQKDGVQSTESGLQYQVIEPGEGTRPDSNDVVTFHYRGTLLDGTEFDSSYSREEPATLPVNRVIPGWQEALQMMKPGGKWRLWIPPDLAYGEQGAPPRIGPNQALAFEVALLEVQKQETPEESSAQ